MISPNLINKTPNKPRISEESTIQIGEKEVPVCKISGMMINKPLITEQYTQFNILLNQ